MSKFDNFVDEEEETRMHRLEEARVALQAIRSEKIDVHAPTRGANDSVLTNILIKGEQTLALTEKELGGMSGLSVEECSVLLELRLHLAVDELRKPPEEKPDAVQAKKYLDQILCYDGTNPHAHWLQGLAMMKLDDQYDREKAFTSLERGIEQ